MTAVVCRTIEEYNRYRSSREAVKDTRRISSALHAKTLQLQGYTLDGVVHVGTYFNLPDLQEIEGVLRLIVKPTEENLTGLGSPRFIISPSEETCISYFDNPVPNRNSIYWHGNEPFVKLDLKPFPWADPALTFPIGSPPVCGEPAPPQYTLPRSDVARSCNERKLLEVVRDLTEEQIGQVIQMAEVIGKLHPRKREPGEIFFFNTKIFTQRYTAIDSPTLDAEENK